jgi:hypothetical protein
VSAPLAWDEVADCDPAEFTVVTMRARFERLGDRHAGMDAAAGSLEGLLELAARDEASGLGDAPWPPHFAKGESESTRVAPSRAKSASRRSTGTKAAGAAGEAAKAPAKRVKAPLITIANSPDKDAALAGLERWKDRHPEVAALLAVDDVLVDRMRGRSSIWTRIRVNLRNVPELQRPVQGTPDPDEDPTRGWRA